MSRVRLIIVPVKTYRYNMKVNGQTIVGEKFAYDGCHKMYVLETEQEEQEAIKFGYELQGPEASLV